MLSLAQVIKDVKDNIENILNIMAPKAYVDKKVADLVNGAPEQLDTLQELSKALNNDKDFGATVNNAIAKKLDLAGGTITGNLTVNGSLAAKASTAGTADRALKADTCTGNAATASSVAWSGITNKPTSFTPASHSHSWESITSKPSTFTPSSHTHAWSQVTNAPATATRWPSWGEVTGKPSSMPANGGTSNATNSINITHSNEICLTRNGQTDGGEYWFGYRNDGATKAITAYKFADGLAKGGLAQITASQFNGNLNGNVAWENVTGKPSTFTPSSHNHDSSYPSTTGTRASGTWGINVTGSAGSVAWGNVTNKPSTFTPATHNHDAAYPSTTGTRASGTWGINVTGSAGSVAWANVSGKPTSMPANGGTASNAGFLNVNTGLTYGNDGLQYFNLSSTSRGTANTNGTPINDWAHIIRMNHGNKTGYYVDLAAGLNSNGLWYRRVTAGSMSGWHTVLDSTNWSNYAPGKTGSGASGTWGINVTGSAGSVAWGNVSGKPSTFAPSSHTHAWSQVTGAPATATRWPSWSEVTGKPSTFTPSSHNHDSAYPSTTGARASGTWGISISGTAANSTKWNNLLNDTNTENNNDTWIPVLNNGKLQHTTKDAMVVGAARKVSATADNGATVEAVKIYCAGNDLARIAAGGKDDNGWLEIATADNSSEPIYVRQYAGDGSTTFSSITRTATLLDGSGNTSFPGTVTAKSFIGNATNDGAGRNIVDTYATKSEVGLAGALGWFKIGNTIIQWGQDEMQGATQTFNFRTKFPNAVGAVIITQNGNADMRDYRVNSWDVNQFEVQSSSASHWRFSWIAVGR